MDDEASILPAHLLTVATRIVVHRLCHHHLPRAAFPCKSHRVLDQAPAG